MSKPELKMEKFDEIQDLAKRKRALEIEQRGLTKKDMRIRENLEDLGILCNNVSNCVAVGRLCFKCKNNYARRNYFRDLLYKNKDVEEYAMCASMFDAAED